MNAQTDPAPQTPALWLTDDHCPSCGAQFTETSSGIQVCQEFRCCGWAVTWALDATGGDR